MYECQGCICLYCMNGDCSIFVLSNRLGTVPFLFCPIDWGLFHFCSVRQSGDCSIFVLSHRLGTVPFLLCQIDWGLFHFCSVQQIGDCSIFVLSYRSSHFVKPQQFNIKSCSLDFQRERNGMDEQDFIFFPFFILTIHDYFFIFVCFLQNSLFYHSQL